MDNFEEDNTKEVAHQIFSLPPSEPNTISLGIENDLTSVDTNLIRDVVSLITLHGIEYLFNHRNIMELSEEQFLLVKRYTLSYGFDVSVEVNEDAGSIMIKFSKCLLR